MTTRKSLDLLLCCRFLRNNNKHRINNAVRFYEDVPNDNDDLVREAVKGAVVVADVRTEVVAFLTTSSAAVSGRSHPYHRHGCLGSVSF